MRLNDLKSRIGGALLGFAILFGIGMASSMTAQAQYRNDDQWRRERDWRREQARRQRDQDRDYEERHRDWHRRHDNDRDDDDYYGRNDGYYGRNNGYYNVYQVATDNGYQAGLNVGAEDAQRGQRYDPRRSHYWKSGTDGYNSSYGSKGQYKQAYRDGFERGYDEGFRRYGYNNNGRYRRNTGGGIGAILGGILNGRP